MNAELLEPHPVHFLPNKEQGAALGKARLEKLLRHRAALIAQEREDPLRYGFKPDIWDLTDDLLVDGQRSF